MFKASESWGFGIFGYEDDSWVSVFNLLGALGFGISRGVSALEFGRLEIPCLWFPR